MRIDAIPAGPDGVDILRGFARRCTATAPPERCEHRAVVAVELAVAARVWRTGRPALADWYAAGLRVALGLDAENAGAAAARVGQDLRRAGWSRDEIEVATALVAAALAGTELPVGSEREPLAAVWRLSALAAAADGLAPWLRYGSAGDGGAFALTVARRSGHEVADIEAAAAELGDDAPWPGDAGDVATSHNRLDAATLLRFDQMLRSVESDAAEGAAIAVVVSDWIADLRRRLDAGAVPLRIPAPVLVSAPRLELPISFDPTATFVPDGVGFAYRRLLAVSTDGAYVSARPHLTLDGGGSVAFAEAGAGLHLPGVCAVAFESPGRLPVDALDDGGLPALGEAFDTLESLVADATWFPIEEQRAVGNPGLSVFVDGDTYFDSLRPILTEAIRRGYRPVALHTYRADTQQLDALPIALAVGEPDETHLLVVRGDGYVLQPWDPENVADPTVVPRVTPEALLALHGAVAEQIELGVWDPSRALTIRVDDGSTDYGIIANLVAAMAYRRPLEAVETELDLLRTAPEAADGVPTPLVEPGLYLAL